ncbi:hypothetical protein A4A49_53278 [Nicotiana attenuata]|uniref:Uncharacterized protein n=1 Tax=Nicotiana attenuata TaxID=49451 RepID=A0A1J6JFZ0_NICAT|nr:hypothetical protein A4A49_53278 [Nicotiana attenuata]
MGPSSYRRSTRRSTTSSQKQQPLKKNEEISTISPCKTSLKNNSTMIDGSNSSNEYCCSTPKAKRYQIQEIKTCPPAPKKKRRIVSSKSCNTSSSLKRTPISLFTPPDSELFLLFAFRDIPV